MLSVLNENFLKQKYGQHFVQLVELDLSRASIGSLDPKTAFNSFHCLTHLWINNNKITSIEPCTFHSLNNLVELNLSHNKIIKIQHDTFQGLLSLSVLYLNNNRIHIVENGAFNGLCHLKKLSLSNNYLNSIQPRIFKELTQMTHLWLYDNRIISIEKEVFQGLVNLERLLLNGNKIRKIKSGVFEGLSNLIHLNLHSNFIDSLDRGLFCGLDGLNILDLNNNQIKEIQLETFDHLKKLTVLWLNFNRLSSLDADVFKVLTNNAIKLIALNKNAVRFNSFVRDNYLSEGIKSPDEENVLADGCIFYVDEFLKQFITISTISHPSDILCDPFVGKSFKNDRYKIKLNLGSGGFGRVYLSVDKSDSTEKAIKIIPVQDMFLKKLKDIEILKMINSEFIIKYYDHFVENYNCFIVTENCKNGDLAKLIKEYKEKNLQIDISNILDWTLQAANGLKDLHTNRIIHRDIKPGNIFLTGENRIKLGDLGIGKIIENSRNEAETFVGTFPYMSPEMIEGKNYSYNTDIWSLGCVVYEMLFFKLAFPAPFIKQSVEELDFKNSILTSIMKQMLKLNPRERPTSDNLIQTLKIDFMEMVNTKKKLVLIS